MKQFRAFLYALMHGVWNGFWYLFDTYMAVYWFICDTLLIFMSLFFIVGILALLGWWLFHYGFGFPTPL